MLELLAGEFGIFVGRRKVGTETGEAEVGEGLDVGDCLACLVGEDATTAHAGVDGEVDVEWRISVGEEGVEVIGFMQGRDAGDPAVRDDFGVFFIEAGAEEVDGRADAGCGEAAGFSDVGDADEGEIF